ncbi:MAG TPA: cytochrome c biogenesis protein CcsA [Candidatus Aquabacterium excrementipullorum]|nr:cytochrome c biogenesis protein CcsA [Candidatus Aquabacterium excrementipullorum]
MILSPTLLPLVATALAAGAYGLAALWPARPAPETQPAETHRPDQAWWLLAFGWAAHAVAIISEAFDWSAPVPVARFGFAPALSVTFWLVLAIYAWERLQLDSPVIRRSLAGLAATAVVLACLYPGQDHPAIEHGLAPLHWVLGIASYGLFGAALLHAVMWRLAERRLRDKTLGTVRKSPGIPLLKLESLTLRFVLAGFIVLTMTLVLGTLFANPWRWDHKTLFSIMSWVVFAVLLTGRHWLGWRGKTAISWLYAGSALLLLAYVGSRFVMEVVLHRPSLST